TNLNALGNFVLAYGTNSSGDVAGQSASTTNKALVRVGSTTTNVGTLGGFSWSVATGVNSSGKAVGFSESGFTNTAFTYQAGVLTSLPALDQAWGINSAG